MSITYPDFVAAIRALEKAWRSLTVEMDWESLDVVNHGDGYDIEATTFLRIKRRLSLRDKTGLPALRSHETATTRSPLQYREDAPDHDSNNDKEPAILEDDPELLPRQPAQQDPAASSVIATYDILHSPTYQVPVLYLRLPSAKNSTPVIDLEALYTLLVPSSMHTQLAHVGVMGALSQTQHPLTGMTLWFVHPCRTAEAMGGVIKCDERANGLCREVKYLLAWFGIVGSGAGLTVPTQLAEIVLVRTAASSRR